MGRVGPKVLRSLNHRARVRRPKCEGMNTMRRALSLSAAVIVSLIVAQAAAGQALTFRGTTPMGPTFDGLRGATTRPVPEVSPPPAPATPDTSWVPDRYVQVPGVDGLVLVPGHRERALSDHEVYTPPLVGRTPDGGVINFPAGVRPPVGERQGP